MLGLVNGYLVGVNDETGVVYLSIKVTPKQQEQINLVKNKEVISYAK